jgi:hypothetical protein
MAVALDPPLSEDSLISNLEGNLLLLRDCFPGCPVLLENLEFIPETLSRGAYRYVGDATFFSKHVTGWHGRGMVDGIVFDIAHGLIAAGNHPFFNGLEQRESKSVTEPITSDAVYLEDLKGINGNKLLDFFSGYIDQMPLSLIEEIHLSGIIRTSQGVWVDAHNEVGELELDALWILLSHDAVRGRTDIPVTLEYGRDWRSVSPQMKRIRGLIASL